MIVRYLHRKAIWTAAISAALGAVWFAALLSAADGRSDVPLGAGAAMAGVVSLLLSVLLAYFQRRRRSQADMALPGSPTGRGDCAACLHRRREVLDERLDIDEPRLCSQYMLTCTCWSFCGGDADENCVSGATPPGAEKLFRTGTPMAQANGLRMVHRSGMDGCPFRYASPLARSAPDNGATLNCSDSGTATR